MFSNINLKKKNISFNSLQAQKSTNRSKLLNEIRKFLVFLHTGHFLNFNFIIGLMKMNSIIPKYV